MLLDHPATADRLAGRLCEQFLGEGAVDAAARTALATGLREHHLDIGWAVGTVLHSQAFFAEANLGKRVVGPVEYLIGAVRALELFEPPPSTLLLAEWAARLGQDLFYPPNVGGWTGGRSWLTTQSIIGRANYAAAVVSGQLTIQQEAWDGLALARRHGRGSDLEDALVFYGELLLGGVASAAWRTRIRAALGPEASANAETLRRAVALMLASPEGQLA